MPNRAKLPDVPLSGSLGLKNPIILIKDTRLRVSEVEQI